MILLVVVAEQIPAPEVIKFISCSTQLSMKFQLLIKANMLKIKDLFCYQTLKSCIYHVNNILTTNANNCHKNININSNSYDLPTETKTHTVITCISPTKQLVKVQK